MSQADDDDAEQQLLELALVIKREQDNYLETEAAQVQRKGRLDHLKAEFRALAMVLAERARERTTSTENGAYLLDALRRLEIGGAREPRIVEQRSPLRLGAVTRSDAPTSTGGVDGTTSGASNRATMAGIWRRNTSTAARLLHLFQTRPYTVFTIAQLAELLKETDSEPAIRQALRRLAMNTQIIRESRGEYTLNNFKKKETASVPDPDSGDSASPAIDDDD
jgi:hypothetical protein